MGRVARRDEQLRLAVDVGRLHGQRLRLTIVGERLAGVNSYLAMQTVAADRELPPPATLVC